MILNISLMLRKLCLRFSEITRHRRLTFNHFCRRGSLSGWVLPSQTWRAACWPAYRKIIRKLVLNSHRGVLSRSGEKKLREIPGQCSPTWKMKCFDQGAQLHPLVEKMILFRKLLPFYDLFAIQFFEGSHAKFQCHGISPPSSFCNGLGLPLPVSGLILLTKLMTEW